MGSARRRAELLGPFRLRHCRRRRGGEASLGSRARAAWITRLRVRWPVPFGGRAQLARRRHRDRTVTVRRACGVLLTVDLLLTVAACRRNDVTLERKTIDVHADRGWQDS